MVGGGLGLIVGVLGLKRFGLRVSSLRFWARGDLSGLGAFSVFEHFSSSEVEDSGGNCSKLFRVWGLVWDFRLGVYGLSVSRLAE